MEYDHQAIRKAYPDELLEIVDGKGIFKINTDQTEIFTVDQTKVDTARTTLNAEALAVKYKTDRTTDGKVIYDSWRNQLAMLYDDILAGKLDATGSFAAHNKAVKDANPKES